MGVSSNMIIEVTLVSALYIISLLLAIVPSIVPIHGSAQKIHGSVSPVSVLLHRASDIQPWIC